MIRVADRTLTCNAWGVPVKGNGPLHPERLGFATLLYSPAALHDDATRRYLGLTKWSVSVLPKHLALSEVLANLPPE